MSSEKILPLYFIDYSNGLKFPSCIQLKTVRVCGPRYWPQIIELTPEGRFYAFVACSSLRVSTKKDDD